MANILGMKFSAGTFFGINRQHLGEICLSLPPLSSDFWQLKEYMQISVGCESYFLLSHICLRLPLIFIDSRRLYFRGAFMTSIFLSWKIKMWFVTNYTEFVLRIRFFCVCMFLLSQHSSPLLAAIPCFIMRWDFNGEKKAQDKRSRISRSDVSTLFSIGLCVTRKINKRSGNDWSERRGRGRIKTSHS